MLLSLLYCHLNMSYFPALFDTQRCHPFACSMSIYLSRSYFLLSYLDLKWPPLACCSSFISKRFMNHFQPRTLPDRFWLEWYLLLCCMFLSYEFLDYRHTQLNNWWNFVIMWRRIYIYCLHRSICSNGSILVAIELYVIHEIM